MTVRSIEAVVFDLDGLLVDSEPLQLAAWDTYLARYGAVLTPDVLGKMLGLRLVDSAIVVVEALDLPVHSTDVVRERDAIFLASVPGNIRPMAGALDLVISLRAAGIRLALATSGHRTYVDLALGSAGLTGMFDHEVTGELVQRGKPAPDTYLLAAELLGLVPSACLALEDAPNGVKAAVAAGMPCLAVPNQDTRDLDFGDATAILDSLDDVIPEITRRGWIAG